MNVVDLIVLMSPDDHPHGMDTQQFQDMPEIWNWSWTKDFSEPAAPPPLAKEQPRAQLFSDA